MRDLFSAISSGAAIVLVLLPMTSGAVAQPATGRDDVNSAEAAESGDPFSAESLNLQFYGGAITESFGGNDETVVHATAAAEYFLWDGLAVVGELAAYGVDQVNPDSVGVGLNALGRWYPRQLRFGEGDELAFYIEGGVGIAQFSERTPAPIGTHFAFTLHGGIGSRWRISEGLSLIGALDYFHISNARIAGKGRNQGLDGLGGYLGVSIEF